MNINQNAGPPPYLWRPASLLALEWSAERFAAFSGAAGHAPFLCWLADVLGQAAPPPPRSDLSAAAAAAVADGSLDLLHVAAAAATPETLARWRPKLGRCGVLALSGAGAQDALADGAPFFAFSHAGGLTVLGIGPDLPDDLRQLFAAQAAGGAEADSIRVFFARLGRAAQQGEAVARLSRENRRLAEALADSGGARGPDGDGLSGDDAVHPDTVRRYRDLVIARDRQIDEIYASTSWRATLPLRFAGGVLGALRRVYRSRRHGMTLEPLQDAVAAGAGWKSVGDAPLFRLRSDRGALPTNWCVISYRVAAAEPLLPSLYVDAGTGDSGLATVYLPTDHDGVVRQLALLPPLAQEIRFSPLNRPGEFAIADFAIEEIGKVNLLAACLERRRSSLAQLWELLRRRGPMAVKQRLLQEALPIHQTSNYASWVQRYDALTPQDRDAIAAAVAQMVDPPLISIVMPVYNPPEPYLRRALDTVIDQLYPHWELCVADDASTAPHVAAVLAEYAAREPRIKVVRRERNGHISAASNSALALATGDFVALMDHDDELPRHALYVVADEISRHPDVDIIYSDEDKIDENGRRHTPYFKSDYNPDLLHCQNMFNHLSVFRRSLITGLGGFRLGFEGSQDYDLVLRAVEATGADRIRHIPMVLYHWRVFSTSESFSTIALPTAVNAARRALEEHFARRGVAATVEPAPASEHFSRIRYPLPDPAPRVSLIIPTRDRARLLRGCVDGILHRTDYPDIEILIVDNGSVEPETRACFAALQGDPRVRVLPCPGPFNYSAINNFAAAQATGSLIGLINNDIEVIGPDWLREMASHALRPEVGAVGAKLLYADDTVQHAGVVTGICGVAGHIHRFIDREDHGYFSQLQLVRDASCVTAACLVMRRAVFDAVGGLDADHLAVAFNDVDLCLRVREQGLLVVWTPYAELHHLESATRGPDTAPDKIHRFMRETDYMNRRWGDALRRDPYYNPNLTLEAENLAYAFPPRVVKPWRI